MLTLTTYIDESQHDISDRHVVVAGFCGSEEQWTAFLPDWQKALGNKKALHMNRLRWNGARSEFRVRDFLSKLGPIPYRHGLCPVYGAARVNDYFDLIENDSEFTQKIRGYVLCLSAIFSALVRDCPGYSKMNVVCEQQTEYEPLARGLFDSFSQMAARNPRHAYFNSIQFIRKDESPLTQPGDFLAFAMAKHLDENRSKKDLWSRPIFGGKNPRRVPGLLLTREKARKNIAEIVRNVKRRRGLK